METKIRKASVEDAKVISYIGISSWQNAYRGIIPDTYLDSLSVEQRAFRVSKSMAVKNVEFAVAEMNNEPVGVICFHPASNKNAMMGIWEVEALYILPQYWRKGIGSALMNYAFHFLFGRNIAICDVWVLAENHNARKFYERIGMFLSGDEETITIGGKELVEVCYRIHVDSPA